MDKKITNWREKFKFLSEFSSYGTDAYQELQDHREDYDKIQGGNDNIYNTDAGDIKKNPNLLCSGMIAEGVDIFSRGMKFPTWEIDAIATSGAESLTKTSLLRAALNWMIRESGFEEAYRDSKEPWALHGDAYRRPFKKKIGEGKWYPQYELVSSKQLLLDTESTELWSKTMSKSSSWVANIEIYSKSQIKRRFGKDILEYIEVGAHIDTNGYNEKIGDSSTAKDKEYYEVIELGDIAEPVEAVLVGQNWLPVQVQGDFLRDGEKKPAIINKLGFMWSDEYPHINELGDPYLNLFNTGFYNDRENIRNKGIGHRLYRPQKADEALQNTALNASRLRGVQIPVMMGVNSNVAQDRFEEWKERREDDVLAFLDVSANMPGTTPKVEVVKFDGVPAAEMETSVNMLYRSQRNYNGIDLNRLEVRGSEGLGQTKLIEAEKVETVEDVVEKQMTKLEHELRGIALYFINNKGFGLADVMLTYTKVESGVKSASGEEMPDLTNPHATLNLVEAAKALENFTFDVHVDMDSIVKRNQLSLMEDLTKVAGLVDGAVMPDEKKAILKQIFGVARITIPESGFGNVAQEQAQGGVSQFQGGAQGGAQPQLPPQ